MYEILNPLRGTVLADSWYLKRKSNKGRVAHLIHPVSLNALCGAPHCFWQWVEEESKIATCTKCAKIARDQ